MQPIVKELIEKAQATERGAFEKERDEFLVELGLCEEGEGFVKREYGARYGFPYVNYDPEKKAYYREIKGTPIKVSDEEYEALKRYYGKRPVLKKENIMLSNGAEKFLGVINTLVLIASIILAIMLITEGADSRYSGEAYIIGGFAVALISLISFSTVKVLLNISNNLHEINSKLK